MPCCVLRVSGSSHKVRRFLAETKLRPCSVHFRGETDFKSRGPNKTSGFNVAVTSSNTEAPLARQAASAFRFIERHRAEFQRVKAFGFRSPVLDFGLRDLSSEERPWPTYKLPPKLVALAGELGFGIELSFYGP
jgi:hypothetical protein